MTDYEYVYMYFKKRAIELLLRYHCKSFNAYKNFINEMKNITYHFCNDIDAKYDFIHRLDRGVIYLKWFINSEGTEFGFSFTL